jgi:CBS domain-containing protein
MKIRDVMTRDVEYVPSNTTLREAAECMARLDAGFLPIGNSSQDKLQGVITDRDITIRGVARGLDPNTATIEQVKSDRVHYCYEDESLEDAARHMGEQQIYRLIVLDIDRDKRMTGVISLADIARSEGHSLAGQTTVKITH